MRIAIGGFLHESNTFAPLPADRQRFREGSLTYGDALIPVWQQAHHEVGGFIEGAKFGYEVVPVAMAWATPAGPVTDEFYDHFTDALTTGLRLARADGVLLALHGAMVTPKYPDADAETLRRVRAALGSQTPIAVTLDFHANVSPQMTQYADILIGYQTYPHVDQRGCGLRAAELLTQYLKGTIRPVGYVAKPALMLNLLGQETAREPMASLMKQARAAESLPGVLAVSVMAGFPYADVPDMGASIIVVTDNDRDKAQNIAEELAGAMWDVRDQLNVAVPSAEEAVRRAIDCSQPPALLIDLGDNIGGGSAGDGTVLLAELLRQQARGFIITLYAPTAVQQAKAAGIGATVDVVVGGSTGRGHGEPIRLRGVVRSLHEGQWVEAEARHGGRRWNNQGHTAVLDLGDDNLVVVNSLRTPPFSLGQLTSLGIHPAAAKIIVVKAAVAYKAAYAPLQGTIIEVDTPGLTAINPARFEYHRIRRPLYPLV
ncbi:MAG: M81 family metallopeptidase [Gemmataceae bacterium]|nr:M81 family metallopeptidase [Gemmata sp.]MDW8196718.1 M81 family metallopeptidase [Gemmataceae bacterium]